MKQLYSAVYNDSYPFHTLLDNPEKVLPVTHPAEMLEFDSALIVWGGADISPELYKHPTATQCWPGVPRRDKVEWDLMKEAVAMEIPIIAICRGAQMACALAGGFLIQDVKGHAGSGHYVRTFDNNSLYVNSLHHQMMVPYNTEHELVAWSSPMKGAPYTYRDDKEFKPENYGFADWKEPEFVYFPKINAYAIQWHPEMMDNQCLATQYVMDFIRKKEASRKQRVWAVGKEMEKESEN